MPRKLNFEDCAAPEELQIVKDDGTYMTETTKKIGCLMLVAEMGAITRENIDEFMFRIRLVERASGDNLQCARSEIERYVGAWMDFGSTPHQDFVKKVFEVLDIEVRRVVQREFDEAKTAWDKMSASERLEAELGGRLRPEKMVPLEAFGKATKRQR